MAPRGESQSTGDLSAFTKVNFLASKMHYVFRVCLEWFHAGSGYIWRDRCRQSAEREYVRHGHLDCLGRSPDPSTLAELPLSGQQDSGVRRGLARLQRGNSDHSTTRRRDYGKTDRGCKLIWHDQSFLSCTCLV